MTYESQPGTIPHRAIAYLKTLAPGVEHSTAELAELLGQPPASMTAALATPRKHGLLRARTRPDTGKILYWSLGDGVSEQKPDDFEDDEPLHPRGEIVPRPGRKRGASAFDIVPVEPDGQVPLFGAFSDGGLSIQAEGHDLRLQPETTAALRRFLREWGGPLE